MWLKYIGGGVMLLVTLVYGYQYEQSIRRKRENMGAWLALLTHIRTQIACFGTPLSEILLDVEPEVLAVLHEEGGTLTLSTLTTWCRMHGDQCPSEFLSLLDRLLQELGTVWRQEQVERLDYYIQALTQKRDAYSVSSQGATRLRRTLSLCGTLGLILLFW